MEKLTEKELQLMKMLWRNGPSFVRELVEMYPSPKPHFNTVSTYVRLLERKGFVMHEDFGSSYRYSPAVSAEDYSVLLLNEIADKYYDGSIKNLIVSLLKKAALSEDDLWDLMTVMRQSRSRD